MFLQYLTIVTSLIRYRSYKSKPPAPVECTNLNYQLSLVRSNPTLVLLIFRVIPFRRRETVAR